jgi:hypothetical protein
VHAAKAVRTLMPLLQAVTEMKIVKSPASAAGSDERVWYLCAASVKGLATRSAGHAAFDSFM